jgi:hypothetical protein
MKKVILLIITSVILSSCSNPTLYYWDDYPKSLYDYRKDANEKDLNNHVELLEKIIKTSNRRHIRVAPGLHAELGYYYLTLNRAEEAHQMFLKEKEIYPESEKLMLQMIERAGGPK